MLVDKGGLLRTVEIRLARLQVGQGLLIQPYKKDRSVWIIKREEQLEIIEDGFKRDRFLIAPSRLKKSLKTLMRREFPRSHKLHLGRLSEGELPSFHGSD
ncbi:MAG: hypothetical protein ABFS19_13190 [Thermodesulfobacteriota bacterium]